MISIKSDFFLPTMKVCISIIIALVTTANLFILDASQISTFEISQSNFDCYPLYAYLIQKGIHERYSRFQRVAQQLSQQDNKVSFSGWLFFKIIFSKRKFIFTSCAFATLRALQKHILGNCYFDTEKTNPITLVIIANYFNFYYLFSYIAIALL